MIITSPTPVGLTHWVTSKIHTYKHTYTHTYKHTYSKTLVIPIFVLTVIAKARYFKKLPVHFHSPSQMYSQLILCPRFLKFDAKKVSARHMTDICPGH